MEGRETESVKRAETHSLVVKNDCGIVFMSWHSAARGERKRPGEIRKAENVMRQLVPSLYLFSSPADCL